MSKRTEVTEKYGLMKGVRMLLHLFWLAVLIYVGLAGTLFVAQRKIIFPASRQVYRTPDEMGWAYEEVVLPVRGKSTYGWFIPAPDAWGTVLFSHGNAGNLADRLESIGLFRAMGLDVLVYDYGGYGQSTGRTSEKRCHADAYAMWRYLVEERGVPEERIAVFGRSLGGAVTAALAARVKPGAAIVESTFLSAGELGQEMYPYFPVRWLVRHRFDVASCMPRITCPVLIVHSPDDEIAPYRHGRELFKLANEPKQFLEIGGSHNEGFVLSGGRYTDALEAFLRRLLAEAPAAAQ